MLSWEKLVFDIFIATNSSQSIVHSLLSRIRAFSKILPQIAADFNSIGTKYSIVNICQGGNQRLMSSGGLVVSIFLLAHQTLGYSHHSEKSHEFNAHILMSKQCVNRNSCTTDRVYDSNIERYGKHRDLCRFHRTDNQFFTILKITKTGWLHFLLRQEYSAVVTS